MATSIGRVWTLGLAEQVTKNLPVTTSTDFLEITGITLNKKLTEITSKALTGSRSLKKWMPGENWIEGEITWEVNPDDGLYLFKHVLGTVVTTQPDVTNAPTAYQHVITPANTLPVGLSLKVDKVVEQYDFADCKVNSITLSCVAGELLTASAGIQGISVLSGSAGSPTWTTKLPFTFIQGTFKVATLATPIKSFSVTIDNSVKTDDFVLGKATRDGIDEGERKVTGTFNIKYDSTTIYDLFVAGTAAALELKFEGTTIAGSVKNTFDIDLPQVYFTGSDQSATGPDTVSYDVPFTATWKDSNNPEITLTIINMVATL